ncbi:MAG: CHASE2 domain-containing protein, partial [Gammaproteobacteria bacterium]
MNKYLQIIKRQYKRILLNILLLLVSLLYVTGDIPLGFINHLENVAYDYRLKLTMPNTIDERVVIIDIDEKSLAEIGRWPWGRDRLARMLDELFNYYKVAIVGFDVVFAEADESSGLRILDKLATGEFSDIPEFGTRIEDLRQVLDFDRLFADSLDGRPVILGYYFNTPGEGVENLQTGALPDPVFGKDDFGGKVIDVPVADGFGGNLPEILRSALGSGHFNNTPDVDGIIRRVPLLYEFEGNYYDALSIAVVRAVLGVDKIRPKFVEADVITHADYTGLEWLEIGNLLIPVDEQLKTLVPFRGRQGSFPYVSAVDVIKGRADRNILKDAIVLIGTTTPAMFDLRATPVQEVYPGVEIHANLIAGILNQDIKEKPPYTLGAEFVLMLLTGLFLAILIPCVSPLWANIV